MQTFATKHMAQYPARPTVTQQMLLQAGKEVEEELNTWVNWKNKCSGLAEALSRIPGAEHMNGYALARALEDNFALIDPDVDAVEVLDSFSFEVDQLLNDQCAQWERDNNVQPPYPIGTQLKQGLITGIHEHDAATYLVDEGHGTTRRLVLKYEDAITAAEAAPPSELECQTPETEAAH